VADSLHSELSDCLAQRFPDSDLSRSPCPIVHDIHIGFELGGLFANGSDARLAQATTRAAAILEGCFAPDDRLCLLINAWHGPDPMFGNTTPAYLYELLGGRLLAAAEARDVIPPEETRDAPFRQTLLASTRDGLRWREILAGIAHYEQGRAPSIGQSVYFIAPDTGIAFHMYDDRGCLVFADEASRIVHLYRQHNDWIVDYGRETIDGIFAAGT
jgi:hypothetical protein